MVLANATGKQIWRCNDNGVMDLGGVALDWWFDGGLDANGNPHIKPGKHGPKGMLEEETSLQLFAHELLHAVGIDGHGATAYRHCHDIMGSKCSGPAPPSSWVKIEEGWYPEGYVKNIESSWEVQPYKLRPLNLNLLDQITGSPNENQYQVLKIPIGNHNKNYLLVEYRPHEKLTFDSSGSPAPNGVGGAEPINIQNILQLEQPQWIWFTFQRIMMHVVNEWWESESGS